jgi:hypothetical protein
MGSPEVARREIDTDEFRSVTKMEEAEYRTVRIGVWEGGDGGNQTNSFRRRQPDKVSVTTEPIAKRGSRLVGI